jgi:hypothetical protein
VVSGLVQGPDGQGYRVGVLVVLAPVVLVVVLLLLPERLVAAWELLGGPFGRSGVPQQERLVVVCRPPGACSGQGSLGVLVEGPGFDPLFWQGW